MELHVSADFEAKLVDLICGHIKENPILISNLIEPSINGIISDMDIKELVKQELHQKIGSNETITTEILKGAVFEIIQDNVSIEDKVDSCINSYLDGSQFESKVNEKLDDTNFDDRLTDIINERLNDRTVDAALDDAIEEALPSEDRLHDIIREHVDTVGPQIEEWTKSTIEERLSNDFLMQKISETVQSVNIQEMIPNYIRSAIIELLTPKVTDLIPVTTEITTGQTKRHWMLISSDDVTDLNVLDYVFKDKQNVMIERGTKNA